MDPPCPLGPSLSMEEKKRCPVDPPPPCPVGGGETATLVWPRALLPAHMRAL